MDKPQRLPASSWWVYFDASALIKRYSAESGTPFVNQAFQATAAHRRMCLILGLLEVISTLVRKRNDRRLEEKMFHQALLTFRAEVMQADDFEILSVGDPLILAAAPLIEKHNLNATDAIVLRSALEARERLRSQGERLLLLAADKRLVRAAEAEGIIALDPEVDSLERLHQFLSA